MEHITTPVLTHDKLQSLAEKALATCAGLPEVKAESDALKQNLDSFVAARLKDKASAKTKQAMDNSRDGLLSGYMRQVKAELKFPHTDKAIIAELLKLDKIVKSYGHKLTRMPVEEQTVATSNFLAEVNGLNLDVLASTPLNRWLPLIANANNAYREASESYFTDSLKDKNKDAATDLVPAVTNSLDALFSMLYSQAKVTNNPALKEKHFECEELVDSFH